MDRGGTTVVGDLAEATRLEASGPGRWSVLLDEQWSIGPKMHGGYLLAVLTGAGFAAAEVAGRGEHTAPQAVTGTFLRAPDPGPAVLDAEVLRAGRGATQIRVRLAQEATPCVEAVVTLGGAPTGEHEAVGPLPVELAPFDDCPRSPSGGDDGRGTLPIMDVMDVRLDPACLGFLHGRPSGEGRLSGWVARTDGSPWTPLALLVALDILPPATFDLGMAGWSPTMSLTAHVHAEAAPGPLRATQRVDWTGGAAGDRMHETCLLWDAEGRLVGQANQLAAVRR